MSGEADTSWLDESAVADTDGWLELRESAKADNDDWPTIEDANAGKTTLAFQHMIDACMRGTNRVMACDGQWLAYRPFNRQFDKEANPATRERMAMFLEKGYYRHVGTYDEVQVYELLPGNPYRHDKKQYIIGTDYWRDICQAAKAACERSWSDYHDILGAMATAIKSGRDPAFAKAMWDDTVNQVAIAIQQIGGPAAPTEKEVNEGFTGIRKARGISRGGVIATLNSAGLQKVGF